MRLHLAVICERLPRALFAPNMPRAHLNKQDVGSIRATKIARGAARAKELAGTTLIIMPSTISAAELVR